MGPRHAQAGQEPKQPGQAQPLASLVVLGLTVKVKESVMLQEL